VARQMGWRTEGQAPPVRSPRRVETAA